MNASEAGPGRAPRSSLRNHTKWLIDALRSLNESTRTHIIGICLFVLDQTQFQLKPEYRSDDPQKPLKKLEEDDRLSKTPVGDLLMVKEPTLENLVEAIGRVVNCGIAEGFLITSLYDTVSAVLSKAADPEASSTGEDRLRQDLESIKRNAARGRGLDPEQLRALVETSEGWLSESGKRFAQNVAHLDAWKQTTADRKGQERSYGSWVDFIHRDADDHPLFG